MEIFYTELRKQGNSLILTIPHRIVKANNWEENITVKVFVKKQD